MILDNLLRCKRSPSSFNLQPFQVIVVRDDSIKKQLAESAMIGDGNAYRTKDCSALVVFLADLQVTERIGKVHSLGGGHPDYLASMPIRAGFFLGEGILASTIKRTALEFASLSSPVPEIEPIRSWSSKNTAMAIQTYVLAATSHGLATAIMEGFDPRRTKDILRIPDRYAIPMLVATGYPYTENSSAEPSPRLDLRDVVFDNEFGHALNLEELEDDCDDDLGQMS
jgi:nitroreductase